MVCFAQGPGIPNVSYPQSKVGDLISDDNGYQETTSMGTAPPGIVCSDLGRSALVGFHGGYLFGGFEAPGSASGSRAGQCVVDISDPTNPSITQWFDNDSQGINAHGYAKIGPRMWFGRQYTVDNNGLVVQGGYSFTERGHWDRGGSYAGWAATFKWSYGAVSGLHTLRERENGGPHTVHSQIDLIGTTGIGGAYPYILGNLLIFASDQSDRGVAAYDISDPTNPRLLDVMNGSNGVGGYWVEVWKHYLIFPRRKASTVDPTKGGTVFIVDFEDPTDLKLVAEVPIDGNPMYGQMQDHYAFVDSTKIDLSPLESGGQPVVVATFDEAAHNLDTSQFLLPVGNLLVTGGYPGYGWGQGLGVWVHQADADNRCPEVAYHYPKNGETNYPPTSPLAIMIHETLETGNLELGRTFLVREVGSNQNIDGDWILPMFDVLTYNPYGDFNPGTEYEVIFTEDAFTDSVGNPICDTTPPGDGVAYRFTFTTADGADPFPTVDSFTTSRPSPIIINTNVDFSFTASDNDNLEYRIDFGDGSATERSRTEWSGNSTSLSGTSSHTYTEPGNYRVLLQVRERGTLTRLTTEPINIVVAEPTPAMLPTQSARMELDESSRSLWVVNPDNDSVSKIRVDSNTLNFEVAVGDHPIGLGLDRLGRAWVISRDSDQLQILSASGALVRSHSFDYGSRPTSIVFSPDKSRAFIALEGNNRIALFNADAGLFSRYLPSQPGLNFEFYDQFSGELPASADEPSENFAQGISRRFFGTYSGVSANLSREFEDEFPRATVPNIRGAVNSFAIVFKGQILVPTSGQYELFLNQSLFSGASLSINGVTEIDLSSSDSTGSVLLNLSAGLNSFEVRAARGSGGGGNRVLNLEWQGPGISRQLVPASVIFPAQEIRKPAGMAVSADGSELLVSQFISDDHGGKIFRFDLDSNQWGNEMLLHADEKTTDSGAAARGVPNYIQSLAIDFAGDRVWYGAKKDNIFSQNLTFETSVRAVVGPVDLDTGEEPFDEFDRKLSADIDNHALPSFLRFSPSGSQLFITLTANNELLVLDPKTRIEIDRVQVGTSPSSVAFDSATNKIFVKNYLDRSITVFDGTDMLTTGARGLANNIVATIGTVGRESLAGNVLRGKKLFYSARDLDDHQANPSRMSLDGYLSCATCHLDGGSDGRVWKRGSFGEGFRVTTPLWGRAGVAHGNVHWSANFDEIQDFELDIVNVFGGRGFLENDGGPNTSLAGANANRNSDLDALAGYVASLGTPSIPKSPYRTSGGSMSNQARRGQNHFNALSCGVCHNPDTDYTDSRLGNNPRLHNIGTLKSTSGQRLGQVLVGIDTPTLLGLHASAPYLHDGSAGTLAAVFEQTGNSLAHNISSLNQVEKTELIRFLLELDSSGGIAIGAPGSLRVTGETD